MNAAGILQKLEESGIEAAAFEEKDGTLILKLSAKDQNRLLGNAQLREKVVRQAKEAGFIRVALDLDGGGGWI